MVAGEMEGRAVAPVVVQEQLVEMGQEMMEVMVVLVSPQQ